MDVIEERRKAHLKKLEANHHKEFDERFGTEKSRKKAQQEAVTDEISRRWNAQQKRKKAPEELKPLPENWRDEHWMTLRSMAANYAGVEAKNKAESVAALEAYEARQAAQAA